MTKNISSRVTSHRTVFNYFANFSSLLKSVPIAVTYPEIFWETDFSKSFGGGCDTPDRSRTKPWWGITVGKVSVISKDLVLRNHLLLIKIYPPQTHMKLIQHPFFQKSCLTLDSKSKLSNRKEINIFTVKMANVIEIMIFDLYVLVFNCMLL